MGAGSALNHCLRPFELPIRIFDAPIGRVEGVGCDDVCCQCRICSERVYRLTGLPTSLKPHAELLNEFAYKWLRTSDGLLGEERVQRTSTELMELVGYSSEHRRTVAEHPHRPPPFVTFLPWTTVEHIVEVWIADMKFVRIDSDYWSCTLRLCHCEARRSPYHIGHEARRS